MKHLIIFTIGKLADKADESSYQVSRDKFIEISTSCTKQLAHIPDLVPLFIPPEVSDVKVVGIYD